ncbi:MAG: FHA domain-containing protein [Oscillospiraceae bacterium]|jgi:hypothetical protein|nr:FHA domain-containing protein [Oscillospiraceae bacterium]
MKKLGFEQQGSSTYLVYELGPEDAVDSMGLGMILNNRIPGFAPAVLTQFDDKKQLKYDVTARVPASQYLLGTVNKKRILGVFSGVLRAFSAAEDYMLDTRTIALEMDGIFTDVATADTVLLCVPVIDQRGEAQSDLPLFFKNILFGVQYDEREERDYVTKIMNYLNGSPTFSIPEFKGILDYLASGSLAEASRQQPAPPPPGAVPAAPVSHSAYEAEHSGQAAPVSVPTPMPASISVPKQAEKVSEKMPKAEKAEDSMSLFYLLQHYNKDNHAKYKAQKEEKKSGKKPEKQKTKKQKAAKPTPQPQSAYGFSIPGQTGMPESPAAKAEAMPVAPPPVGAAAPASQPPQQRPMTIPTPAPAPMPPAPAPMSAPMSVPMSVPRSAAAAVEETLYFSENVGDETVLLGREAPVQRLIPHLVRMRNNERIPIDKAVFRLGRDNDYNDYAIMDNRYIGHGHCHILSQDGEFFIVDDNSKNHTQVNGEVIAPGIQVKLAHGYTISIADEKFEFKLY